MAVCVAVPALVGWLTGDLTAGLLASLGGFAGLYGGGRPYLNRARLLVGVALAQAVVVGLGVGASAYAWTAIVTVTAIAAVATWICLALAIQPGSYQIVLCCAAGTALSGEEPVRSGLLVLVGGLFAGLVHVAASVTDWRGPERRAVVVAATAVAHYLESIGGPGGDEARHDAALRMEEAWVVLVAQQPRLGQPGRGLLRLREVMRRLALVLADGMRRDRPDQVGAAQARRLRARARRHWGSDADFVLYALPLVRPGAFTLLRNAVRPRSRSLLVILRVALAAAVAGTLGSVLGLDHLFWAIAAAVLVLDQGLSQRRTIQRGLERTAGTALGVGLAAAILSAMPYGLVLIVLLAGAVLATQILVRRNYAAAAAFITCSALLITGAEASRSEVRTLLEARAVDTAIGCGVAIAVFVLVSRKDAAGWLPSALADTVDAAATAAGHLSPGLVTSPAGLRARRDLQRRLIWLSETYDHGINGFGSQRQAAGRLWPAVLLAERLAYRVLAEGWRLQAARDAGRLPDRGTSAELPAWVGLRQLANAIREGRGVRQGGSVPSFLSRDVADLRRVLAPGLLTDRDRLPPE